MRQVSSSCLSVAAGIGMAAVSAEAVDISAIGDPCRISNEDSYAAFTDVCRLRDGRLAIVYYGGSGHIDERSVIRLRWSKDGGRTWSEPSAVASGDDGRGARDPHIMQCENGDILVSYFLLKGHGTTSAEIRTCVALSRDGGDSWVFLSSISGLATSGKITQADDGMLLMPVYGRGVRSCHEAGVLTSLDGGATWGNYQTLAAIDGENVNEAELVVLGGGRLLALVRCEEHAGYRILSNDGGMSWTSPEPCFVGHAPGLLWNYRLLLVNHRSSLRDPVRGGYEDKTTVLSVSRDEGRSWSTSLALGSPEGSNDCAYGGIVWLEGDEYLASYYNRVPGGTAVFVQRFRVGFK